MIVNRTEQIMLNGSLKISEMCHLAKNLYNEGNYIIRQEFITNGKWIRYRQLDKMLQPSENYKSIPAQSSQQTLMLLDRNWKSFFKSIKEWKKNSGKFKGMPKLPKYKRKDGESLLIFTNQQAKIKEGFLNLPSKIGVRVKTRIKGVLNQVRIIPKGVGYILEIVYEKVVESLNLDRNRIIGIDVGLRNIVTIGNNIGKQPIVVKGGVVKSINQYYNKENARLSEIYTRQQTRETNGVIPKGMRVKKGLSAKWLHVKRDNKINDFFHKTSRFIIDYCIGNNIGTIVFGHNNDWKQNIDLGKKTNQNFVQIPVSKLQQQIRYKAEDIGDDFIVQEESYTSKCSFLDGESIEHHDMYLGKRVSRGIFRSMLGVKINADVNASYNIIRKAVVNAFPKGRVDAIEGVGLHPLIVIIQ